MTSRQCQVLESGTIHEPLVRFHLRKHLIQLLVQPTKNYTISILLLVYLSLIRFTARMNPRTNVSSGWKKCCGIFPRPPKSLPLLAKDAISKFPGLTERGFQRRYFSARTQTGNIHWSRP